jgi:hypothetical protein
MFCTALILLWGAPAADAVEISGRSSTQYSWYNDIVDGSKQSDLSEYIRVQVGGLDDANRLSLQGYGRLVYDVDDGGSPEERLYYLFADYKDIAEKVDVRLGRQFVNLSAGSALIDGVQADIKNIGFVGVTLMGGKDIMFGEKGALTSHAAAGGMAVYLVGLKNTDLDVSYYRAYDYSDIAREMMGFNFKQYLLESWKLYGNARYDLTAEVFSELLGGVKYFPMLDLMLTAEYYESYPTFDTTSIYSVFAVNKYKETVLKADYTALAWLDVSAGIITEDYGDGADADVFELGLRFRPSHTYSIGVFHDDRSGYGGDLSGWKLYVDYSDLKKLKVAAGVDYDVYQRDDMTGDETAKKYWASARYAFDKKMSASIRVEDNVNANYTKDMRGRVTFDVDF